MNKKYNGIQNTHNYPRIIIFLIFLLCLIPHYIEVLYLRTEESFLADNFINKIIGIIILITALKLLHYSWSYIGFRKDKINYLFIGILVGFFCYLIAYGIEYTILMLQNQSPVFEIYVSGFSLTGNLLKQTGLTTYFSCVLFNIINVIMEEGIFRGLFIRLGEEKISFTKANCFAAFFFGLWPFLCQ